MQARATTIITTLTALLCAAVAAPVALGAGAGHEGGDAAAASPVSQAALDRANERAVDAAPAAVGARCEETLDVDGVGDACATRDGLLRVEQADGRSHTIHGMDGAPDLADGYSSASQAALDGADAGDITCAPSTSPRYVLVYAHPGDAASRYSTIAPKLRSETYKVSAFIDSESRSVDAAAGRRLPMQCEGETPVVREARLAGLASGTADFGDVVDGLRALGYEFNGDGSGLQRYIVYYDSPSPSGAAGTGHVFTSDSSAGPGNQNNRSGLYAVEYHFDGGGGVPHWEVLIHEVIHTMGAVVKDAAHSTTAGHCTDGEDIMCYRDSADSTFTTTACSTKVLDCGRDDYFNPAPAAGSFLATHWNAASTDNRWLAAGGGTSREGTVPVGQQPDVAAPAQPAGFRAAATVRRVSLSWTASSDDVGVASYLVSRQVRVASDPTRSSLRTVGSTPRTSLAFATTGLRPGSSHRFRIVARDAAGNTSSASWTTVRIPRDTVAPTRPTKLRMTARSRSTVSLAWSASRDAGGVASYRVFQQVQGRWRLLRSVSASARSLRVVGLRSRTGYAFRVHAVDRSRNVSAASATLRSSTR